MLEMFKFEMVSDRSRSIRIKFSKRGESVSFPRQFPTIEASDAPDDAIVDEQKRIVTELRPRENSRCLSRRTDSIPIKLRVLDC